MSNSELQRIVELEGRLARIEEFISPNPRVPRDLDGLHAELVRLTDKIGSAQRVVEKALRDCTSNDGSICSSYESAIRGLKRVRDILAAP